MTVTVTTAGLLVRASGTIAEVLSELSNQRLMNILWYSDDLTDAKALASRVRT